MSAAATPRFLRWIVVAVALVVVLVPFAWVARVSLKPADAFVGDPGGLGGGFTFSNFSDAWTNGGLGHAIGNSLRVVPLGAVIATTLATLTGFALAKLRFPGRQLVMGMTLLTIAIPLAALVIPLFDEGLKHGYADSRLGLACIYGTIFASWGTLFMYAYFRGIPQELLESAAMDGARLHQIVVRVALPLAVPAIATVFIINIFIQWSELILALVMLPDAKKQTVTASVAQFSTQFRTGGPLTAAGMIIAAAPILLVFLFAQRWLRQGVLTGGVKG